MTPEKLKFDIAMLEDKKRRASFPQVAFVAAYATISLIVCLLIAITFPDGSAPEWLLLLLAPLAMVLWFGLGKVIDHWAPRSDWTHEDRERLHELKLKRGFQ